MRNVWKKIRCGFHRENFGTNSILGHRVWNRNPTLCRIPYDVKYASAESSESAKKAKKSPPPPPSSICGIQSTRVHCRVWGRENSSNEINKENEIEQWWKLKDRREQKNKKRDREKSRWTQEEEKSFTNRLFLLRAITSRQLLLPPWVNIVSSPQTTTKKMKKRGRRIRGCLERELIRCRGMMEFANQPRPLPPFTLLRLPVRSWTFLFLISNRSRGDLGSLCALSGSFLAYTRLTCNFGGKPWRNCVSHIRLPTNFIHLRSPPTCGMLDF